MGFKDRLAAALGKKTVTTREPAGEPAEEMTDFYGGIKSIDEDLFVAAMRMKELADDIVSQSPSTANTDAVLKRIIDSGNNAASTWIAAEFSLPAFLTDSYSKSWSDTPAGKDMLNAVAKAIAVSDAQTAKALQQGIDLIAKASSAMLIHGLFAMSRNPETATATKKAAQVAAGAKTYVLGL